MTAKQPRIPGLNGEHVGNLYDDLQPWAAELCEQAYLDSLSLGRRRRAARMDFVPGWKEAARQMGREDVFRPKPEPPEPAVEEPTAHPPEELLAAWVQYQALQATVLCDLPHDPRQAFVAGMHAALDVIHACMQALADAPAMCRCDQHEND